MASAWSHISNLCHKAIEKPSRTNLAHFRRVLVALGYPMETQRMTDVETLAYAKKILKIGCK